MSKQDTTITRCPSCGAPISMGETRGVCSYCETVVERQGGGPQGEPKFVRVAVTTVRAPKAATAAPRSVAGCLFTLLLGVAVFVAFMLIISGAIPIRQLGSLVGMGYRGWPLFGPERIGDVVQVVPRGDADDSLLVYLYHSGDVTLGLIDGTGRTLYWQTSILSKDARQGAVAVGPDAVYLADQTRLQALHLDDGALIWEASLGVELPPSCEGCLIAIGDHVAALRKDGTLQVFDGQTGQPAWSMRLNNSPHRLPVIGGRLAIIQPVEGGRGAEIQLLDPASGAVTWRITPTCQEAAPESSVAFVSTSSLLFPSPDGAALFVFFDTPNGCVQRWELAANAPAWQSWLTYDVVPSSWYEHDLLVTERRIFIGGNGALAALDATTGALTSLVQDKEHHMIPLFARDNTVVVKATPSWDRSRHILWGLETTSGERHWQYALQSKEWFGDSGFNEWGAQLTPNGVAVVQAPGDSRELIVERLDLRTGASMGRQTMTIDGRGSSVVWANLWTERTAWLLVDNTLATIDLLNGQITTQPR